MIIQQGYSSYSLPCGKGLTTTTTVPVRYRRGRHIFLLFLFAPRQVVYSISGESGTKTGCATG